MRDLIHAYWMLVGHGIEFASALAFPFLAYSYVSTAPGNVAAIGARTPDAGTHRELLARLPTLVVLLTGAHFVLYLFLPNFTDYGEPVVPLLAANILNGATIYGAPNSAHEVIGSNYGPYVFLIQALALYFSPTMFASKAVGIAFSTFALWCIIHTFRSRGETTEKSIGAAAIGIILLYFNFHYWFWSRPDSILLAITALGCLIYDKAKPKTTLIVIGLLAGVACNLKLFAPIYLVPLAIGCIFKMALLDVVLAVLLGGILFVTALGAPFLLPSIDAGAYIENILSMRKQGMDIWLAATAFIYGILVLAIPLLSVNRNGTTTGNRILLISLVVCVLAVSVLAGKPGGGPVYIMPFIPLSLYLTLRLQAEPNHAPIMQADSVYRRLFLVLLICVTPVLSASWYNMGKQLLASRAEFAKRDELRDLFVRFPHAEMGHGADLDRVSDEYHRAQRAFLGQVSRFDYVNYADQRKAGYPVDRMRSLFANCSVPSWIFARSGDKFVGTGYDVELFDDDIRRQFKDTYQLAYEGKYYEVWGCRK